MTYEANTPEEYIAQIPEDRKPIVEKLDLLKIFHKLFQQLKKI